MNKLTRCLKRNEVYFTTICAFLLSFMAVFVSVKSNQIADRQQQMDYYEKQPDFQITKQQVYNPKTKFYEDTELIVTKLSGKAKNIGVSTISLLDVRYSNTNGAYKSTRFLLDGYYNTSFLTGHTDGIVQTETGYRNHALEYQLERKIEEFAEREGEYIEIRLNTFVQLSFLNFQNERKLEYFDASSTSGKLITNDTLSRYFDDKSLLFDWAHRINLNKIDDKKELDKILKVIK